MHTKGKIQLTQELLRTLLQLPDEVIITDTLFDSDRDIVTFIIRSEYELEGLTFDVQEGAGTPSANHMILLRND
ncbi:hypothetical protein [Cytobacillus oceanisediminis]|uniref:hypothetical protein n=1 Tax=Cytobacillus oceanisediminis TaxID=665099 RepID=UPI001FB1B2DE|nr:hypothetical protein [Cytobacillus oceanisediminis]UOE58167.1 hypothetical protein IRB79_27050 [Cytobacillus oceanisediminis]